MLVYPAIFSYVQYIFDNPLIFYHIFACFIFRPDGFVYDKEAILEYILTKKRENSKKMREFEKQKVRLSVSFIVDLDIEYDN